MASSGKLCADRSGPSVPLNGTATANTIQHPVLAGTSVSAQMWANPLSKSQH